MIVTRDSKKSSRRRFKGVLTWGSKRFSYGIPEGSHTRFNKFLHRNELIDFHIRFKNRFLLKIKKILQRSFNQESFEIL